MDEVIRMRLRRMIPPTAAPINLKDLLHGLCGILFGKRYLTKLEFEVRKYFDVGHVFTVSSGKAALTLILLALKTLSSRKQVVIPAYTCFSVPSAVVKAGLEITLCDTDPDSLDFDYDLLEKTITSQTLCVVSNHLFGIPSDVERVNRICRGKGIFVVEDAAQAMGGKQNGKMLGTIGDVGFFSLSRGKNVTCGSGGIIVTNSSEIAGAIERYYSSLQSSGTKEVLIEFFQVMMLSIFIRPSLYWFPLGLPFLKLGQTLFYTNFPVKKMSGMKAGLLWKWKDRLELSNRIRAENAAYFSEQLQLETARESTIPYLRLPVIVESKEIRNKIYSFSQEQGLGISFMYPTAINEIEEIRAVFNGQFFPSAKKLAERLLTIPTHHLILKRDRKAICGLFSEIFASGYPK